jgi:hypothetical protein
MAELACAHEVPCLPMRDSDALSKLFEWLDPNVHV